MDTILWFYHSTFYFNRTDFLLSKSGTPRSKVNYNKEHGEGAEIGAASRAQHSQAQRLRMNGNPLHSSYFASHLHVPGGESWLHRAALSTHTGWRASTQSPCANRESSSALSIGATLREMNLILLILGK